MVFFNIFAEELGNLKEINEENNDESQILHGFSLGFGTPDHA